ncbi:MAG: 1-(5-phosphoribosyl)-5-[(5-phosphoribosylamino)methylideneamino]imidazole-4-carboxamide isomerase [Nitrososphaerota archaeon]|nr:1-(5-phosphoribosyl)-5-[(5-phosphoribosylamino)methylideneamino]imidazole-4-carboxamide isomerase [Candidatus Bathyarchaeota archaeon]MDW8048493.1 1-(5-phosphoribosyl)-5-[(5-phosphoribosylamino)methylideneamino]imidazole-4-carboxamide isomerase [Nitrososphaerota archaeon]
MDIIPAVDIMDSRIVRLERGDIKLIRFYEMLGDPVSLAKRWESEGARIIHVVDLDAALGRGNNLKIIEQIINRVKIPIQLGGGIRTEAYAEMLLRKGVYRIILGSLAFEQPHAAKSLLQRFGDERVIVSLDYSGQQVMVKGWQSSTGIKLTHAIKMFKEIGFKTFFITSIDRDGTVAGPDVKTLSRICRFGVKVIAAGGVRSLDDIIALKRLGVYGVVIGRALYDGLITLSKALSVAEE